MTPSETLVLFFIGIVATIFKVKLQVSMPAFVVGVMSIIFLGTFLGRVWR